MCVVTDNELPKIGFGLLASLIVSAKEDVYELLYEL
jgi:hypothetical protein